MTPNEQAVAAVYAAWFAARQDDYVTWTGDMWVRAGAPLTPSVIWAAWHGGPSVSCYMQTREGTHVAAIDFDSEDGLVLGRRVRSAMAHAGVHAYVEPSRRGSHVWVLMDEVVPARTVRRGLQAFLREAGIPEGPKVELRPAYDEIKADGYGAPLRMATMPHPKTGMRYPLLDGNDKPLSPRLDEMLLAVEWSPTLPFAEMAETLKPSPKDMKSGDRRVYTGPVTEGSASDILRRLWGASDARPSHSIRCPAHDDRVASLSILRDDQRAVCKSPACVLNNNERGRGTYELTVMAPKRGS